jgi:hypothetical protein
MRDSGGRLVLSLSDAAGSSIRSKSVDWCYGLQVALAEDIKELRVTLATAQSERLNEKILSFIVVSIEASGQIVMIDASGQSMGRRQMSCFGWSTSSPEAESLVISGGRSIPNRTL